MSKPPLTQLQPPDLPSGASSPAGSGPPPGGQLTPMTNLKTLLQLPIKSDQRGAKDCCEMRDKDKPVESEENSTSSNSGGPGAQGGVPASGALRPNSQSAFLGPLLWERTLPCDGGLFQLQYMDLEEFLTENGMGMHSNGASSTSAQIPSQVKRMRTKPTASPISSQSAVPSQSSQCPPSSPPPCSSSSSSSSMSSSSSSSSLVGLENVKPQPPPLPLPPPQPQQSMMGGPECLHGGQSVPQDQSPTSTCPPGPPGPPTAANGSSSEVMVNFDPDPADLALSSVPGQEAFDPRRHRFSDEELKPQPMIKKARKMLVPNEQKDEKYWNRRVKNNEAAKRSRDARRLKENQISVRAAFLERENGALRQEVADMRKELGRCRNIINKYENRHGDL
ncbi:D site albumin promoter binding protein a isoform X1 [Limanda limanda]|uniref:D site albumin promoter binding protein a isoform X1 n=1 Tax=Limanda limanda TaxID=27771 RepID=UPI0029C759B7|nr:D site albumin promoter binding protein a isoform X1 [Limanda limanda]